MGVIKRQSFKNSIVQYFGIFLGSIGVMYVYPLDWELYGKIQYWLAFITLMTPLLRFGSAGIVNKFYPIFLKEKLTGFLGITLKITAYSIAVSSILLSIIFTILYTLEIRIYKGHPKELFPLYVLAVLIIFYSIFQYQSNNLKRIVVPELLKNPFQKLVIFTIIICSYFGFINAKYTLEILIVFYVFITLIILFYLKNINGLDLKNAHLTKIPIALRKDILSYWIFGGLNYFGTLLAYKIDLIMIGNLLNDKLVGFYSSFLFLSVIIEIPYKSFIAIINPVISKLLNDNNMAELQTIYKKATNNLLIIAVFLFLNIYININNLLDLMTNGNDLKPYVVIFSILGIAKIIDILSSVNSSVIIYSKYYRVNLIFLFGLGILNIVSNFIFIENFGLIGAAMATAISLVLFNFVKLVFVYFKFRITPFLFSNLIPISLLVLFIILNNQVEIETHPIFSILIKSSVFSVIYLSLIYYLKVSEDLNAFVRNVLISIRNKF